MSFFKRNSILAISIIFVFSTVQSSYADNELIATASSIPSNKISHDRYINAKFLYHINSLRIESIKENAENGDVSSQYILGNIYQNGHGVPTSDVVALMWYTVSAQNGVKDAVKDKKFTEKYMALDQVRLAHRMADIWIARH